MTDPNLLPLRVAERLGRLVEWACQQRLNSRDQRVLLFLIRVGDADLESYWSHGEIAKAVGSGRPAVVASFKSLAALGLIQRIERRRENKSRTSDLIAVRAPRNLISLRQNAEEMGAADHDGDVDVTPVVMPCNEIEQRPAVTKSNTNSFLLGTSSQEREEGSCRQIEQGSRRRRKPRHLTSFAAIADELTKAAA